MGKALRDSDGVRVTAGQMIRFSYGIPPVPVFAPVVYRNAKLVVLTPGHNPSECAVSELMDHVGDFWTELTRGTQANDPTSLPASCRAVLAITCRQAAG